MALGSILGISQNPSYERQSRINWRQPFQAQSLPVTQVGTTGISIPQNNGGYTLAEDGTTSISTGQDGYGLAHRNPEEYNLHLIG